MKDSYGSHDSAEAAVKAKISGVEKEQGPTKSAGSEAPSCHGHGSASSEGVGNSIPKEA